MQVLTHLALVEEIHATSEYHAAVVGGHDLVLLGLGALLGVVGHWRQITSDHGRPSLGLGQEGGRVVRLDADKCQLSANRRRLGRSVGGGRAALREQCRCLVGDHRSLLQQRQD